MKDVEDVEVDYEVLSTEQTIDICPHSGVLSDVIAVAKRLSEETRGSGPEGALVRFDWNGTTVCVNKHSNVVSLADTVNLSRASKVGPYQHWLIFNDALAQTYDPVCARVRARIVTKPADEESTILTEEGIEQTFTGTYVEELDPDTGLLRCGWMEDEWTATHTRLGDGDLWFASAPVRAYPSPEEGWLVVRLTHVSPMKTPTYIYVGDYIVQMSDGVTHLSAGDFPRQYKMNSAR